MFKLGIYGRSKAVFDYFGLPFHAEPPGKPPHCAAMIHDADVDDSWNPNEPEPCTGSFPMEAMRADMEQREAITPALLPVVEAIAAPPTEFAKQEDYMLFVSALHLLAQFREKRAYPYIVKMVSAPGETSFDWVGDMVTEGLKLIFASVYDGNPAPLPALIENEEANEFVRGPALIRSPHVYGLRTLAGQHGKNIVGYRSH